MVSEGSISCAVRGVIIQDLPVGWDIGKASKLNSSKSRASGTGWFVVADGGRAKGSLHHDSQSNESVEGGRGSETACFLGAQSDPRGFLTAGSPEFDSNKRLFREGGGGGVSSAVETVGREGEGGTLGASSGGGVLRNKNVSRYLAEKRNSTYKRRLRDGGEIEWGSDGSSEQDRFRFREG